MCFIEVVSLGHPDKIADYISASILDWFLERDSKTKYKVEVQIFNHIVNLVGYIETLASSPDFKSLIIQALNEIGYTNKYIALWNKDVNSISSEDFCLNPNFIEVNNFIQIKSRKEDKKENWSDIGIGYGIATNQAECNYLPESYYLAVKTTKLLYNMALDSFNTVLGIDIKTQIIDGIVNIKFPYKNETFKEFFPSINTINIKNSKHSTLGKCGMTGRKLVSDFYGGYSLINGGCPWTKDGTNPDLSLNLFARKLSLDFIKKSSIDFCQTIISLFGNDKIFITYKDKNNNVIEKDAITGLYPKDLIEMFNLNKPIYRKLCKNGLFSEIN